MRAWPLRRFERCGGELGCGSARAGRRRDLERGFDRSEVGRLVEAERWLSIGADARRGHREGDVVEGRVFAGRWSRAPLAAGSAAREAIGDVVARAPEFFAGRVF